MAATLKAENLHLYYSQQRELSHLLRRSEPPSVKALDGIDVTIKPGVTLGIVGESGCGKSTLGRALLGLEQATKGTVSFDDRDISTFSVPENLRFRRAAQMIFQDPSTSLNPRMPVGKALEEVLAVHHMCRASERAEKVAELLIKVGLLPEIATRLPRTLSGGQCQRIGIARALALEPEIIVADEAVSALDVSIQAQILNLFIELQRERNLTLVFISHDLEVVRHICDQVIVMYLGKMVESGPVEEVLNQPKHPYTQALVASLPTLDGPSLAEMTMLEGEPPSPLKRPEGCAFHPRCPQVQSKCKQGAFPETKQRGSVQIACHQVL